MLEANVASGPQYSDMNPISGYENANRKSEYVYINRMKETGQPICLCLQTTGAAATKGQLNVNRTRHFTTKHMLVTKGMGTFRCINNTNFSL